MSHANAASACSLGLLLFGKGHEAVRHYFNAEFHALLRLRHSPITPGGGVAADAKQLGMRKSRSSK